MHLHRMQVKRDFAPSKEKKIDIIYIRFYHIPQLVDYDWLI